MFSFVPRGGVLPIFGCARSVASAASPALGLRIGSWFKDVPQAPPDPILGVNERFLADNNPEKTNLGVGAYRDDDGKPVVLESVRHAEEEIAGNDFMEYLPIGGLKALAQHSVELAYGKSAKPLKDGTVAAVQALSGTGACRLFADFQKRFSPGSRIFIPTPTWSNHHNIWRDAQVEQGAYRYWDPKSCGLDFEGMMQDLNRATPGDVVLFHACAHNPTGVDPTPDQWKEVCKLVAERTLFPFFDMAYQGFASGDFDRDAQAIRIFLDAGLNLGLAQSYAKNMGLYGQRVGCLSFVTESPKEAKAVESQIKAIARPMYSNPPLHGALLVDRILSQEHLREKWAGEVRDMAKRIADMRQNLRQKLEAVGSQQSWQHITDQIGMFCYSGLSAPQVDRLEKEFSIYMTRNGRISMAGVNSKNVDRLAQAIHKVMSEGSTAQLKAA